MIEDFTKACLHNPDSWLYNFFYDRPSLDRCAKLLHSVLFEHKLMRLEVGIEEDDAVDAACKMIAELGANPAYSDEDRNYIFAVGFKNEQGKHSGSALGAALQDDHAMKLDPENSRKLLLALLENGLSMEHLRTPDVHVVAAGHYCASVTIPNQSLLHRLAGEYGTAAEEKYGYSPFETFLQHKTAQVGGGGLIRSLANYKIVTGSPCASDSQARCYEIEQLSLLGSFAPEGQRRLADFALYNDIHPDAGFTPVWLGEAMRQRGPLQVHWQGLG